MKQPDSSITEVEDYINRFDGSTKFRPERVCEIVHANGPDAAESIAYGIPACKQNRKPSVYFAGYPHCIGFYATPVGHAAFVKELVGHKQGKGSAQFPLNQLLPQDLLARMVRFRVKVVDKA